jgi:hypothetical protein
MNFKVLTMLMITTLVGCGADESPTKEDKFTININEDQVYDINLDNDFDQPMKSLNVDLSTNDILTVNFDVKENVIQLNPAKDKHGEATLTLSGEDGNGTPRIFIYQIIINSVEDSPMLTVDDIKVEYTSLDKIYTGVDITDVDSEIGDFTTLVAKNNDKVELFIEENRLYIKPNLLGLNETISYKLLFTDKGEIYEKDVNMRLDYVKGQIPLTDESLTSITILEDNNYIGKIEPQKLQDGQEFEVVYDLEGLVGQLIEKDNYEFEYIPVNNYNGIDKFNVIISSSTGDVVTKEINITVVSDIDALVVANVEHILGEDTIANIPLNIIDPENNVNYNYSVISGLNNGILDFSKNSVVYTPNKDFFGVENIVVNLIDTVNNRSVDFSLKVDVISSLDPLAIEDKEIVILRGHNYSELFSFYDAENGEYSFGINDATDGETSISRDGTYNYDSNINGTITEDSFLIYVLDSNLNRTDEVTVTVKILDSNSPNELLMVDEDTLSSQILVRGVIEGEESDYAISVASEPSSGVVTLNSNKTFTYKGLLNYNGDDSFSLNIKDVTTDAIYIVNYDVTVNPIPDGLEEDKINKNLSVLEDNILTYDLSQLDIDKNGETRYNITGQSTNGELSVDNVTGFLTYTPFENFNGEDTFQVRITKDDVNQIIDADFNIRIISGEDPLYLTSPIEIEMYESTKYSFNIRDITVNEDPEDFIYIGDDLIDETLWTIDTGVEQIFDITLDALTGELTVVDLGLLSKNDIREYPFSIREEKSGTVREFSIQIKIIDDLFFVNNLLNLPENVDELTSKNNLLFCPGEYTVGENDFVFQADVGIYGMDNNLVDVDSNMDVFHSCSAKTGDAVMVINGEGSIILDSNTIMNGMIIKRTSELVDSTIKMNLFANNIEFLNNQFISEVAGVDDTNSYVESLNDAANLTFKKNTFKGFQPEAVEGEETTDYIDEITALNISSATDDLLITENTFDNLSVGIVIGAMKQSDLGKIGIDVSIDKSIFLNVNKPIFVKSTNITENILNFNISENLIDKSIEAIKINNVSSYDGSYVNINILINIIENSKSGINVNETGKGLTKTNIKINENEISVFELFGIKVNDQVVTSQTFLDEYKELEIKGNNIQMIKNTLSEDNNGILIIVGYYDVVSESKDRGIPVEMLSDSIFNVTIQDNVIGDKTSDNKFNKYGIGFIKDSYDYAISGIDKYNLNALLIGNSVFARNDFVIDDVVANDNKYAVNINLVANAFESVEEPPSVSLKENNTNLCLYFIDNVMDLIDLSYNLDNSTVSVADIDGEKRSSLFNNNTIKNALTTNVIYPQIENCH